MFAAMATREVLDGVTSAVDRASFGVLTQTFGPDLVDIVADQGEAVQQRRGEPPARLTLYLVPAWSPLGGRPLPGGARHRREPGRLRRLHRLCEQAVARVTIRAGEDPELREAVVYRLLHPAPDPGEELLYRVVWVAALPSPMCRSRLPG